MSRLRPEAVASIVNGLLVVVMPLALVAWADAASRTNTNSVDIVHPLGMSFVSLEAARLLRASPMLLPFAALAAWRTWVYARLVVAGISNGWSAVGGAVASALAVFILMMVPGFIRNPDLPLPVGLVSYLTFTAGIGLLVGLAMRASALIVLRLRRAQT